MKEGDKLLIYGNQFTTHTGRSRKLEPRWYGPFTVVSYDPHTQNYTVDFGSKRYQHKTNVFHCSVIKPYKPNDDDRFPSRRFDQPAPIKINMQNEWEVDRILDYREQRGNPEFLIRWKGFSRDDDSWEPFENLENAQELVQKWWDHNMPGEDRPYATAFITIGWQPDKAANRERATEPEPFEFWQPYTNSEFTSSDEENWKPEKLIDGF